MMKKYIEAILFSIALFSFNCNKNDNPVNQSNANPVLMELKIGNQWVYRATILDSAGSSKYVDTVIFKIIRDTLIQGERWYQFGFGFYGGLISDSFEWFTNKSDGLWSMTKYPSESKAQIILFAKYPFDVNDIWLGYDSCTTKVVAKDVGITVPFGNYNCIQYSYTYKNNTQFVSTVKYFSVGKGWVRDEFYSMTSGGQKYLEYKRELIALTLNKYVGSINSKSIETKTKYHRVH